MPYKKHLDKSEKISEFRRMVEPIVLTPEIKALAISLGASYANVAVWDARGIPPKWELKLLEALGNARIATQPPTHRRGRPPNVEAAE